MLEYKKIQKYYETGDPSHDRLNTEPAKVEGKKRMKFMKEFLKQLQEEISS